MLQALRNPLRSPMENFLRYFYPAVVAFTPKAAMPCLVG